MKYNELGNTGITVSEIGIGCEGLNGRDAEFTSQFIDKCFELGINCIDLYSPNPDLRKNLASALRGRRDKFVLQSHLCSIWRNGQYERTRDLDMVKRGFEDMLSELSTDYIDIAMVTKLLNLAKAQNEIPETVREHYNLLEARGGDCIGCGACEKRCPFGVKIKENMIEAKRIFGS